MNPHLQAILGFFRQNKKFTAEEKKIISKSLEDIDEEIKMLHCELEIKNKQLEIESSLERVRIIAMGMEKPDDLLSICEILYKELKGLGFDEIRNSQIIICDDEKK